MKNSVTILGSVGLSSVNFITWVMEILPKDINFYLGVISSLIGIVALSIKVYWDYQDRKVKNLMLYEDLEKKQKDNEDEKS